MALVTFPAVIRRGDLDVLEQLPNGAVLLSSIGEVFQLREFSAGAHAAFGPMRGWFSPGYGQTFLDDLAVEALAPLRVLFPLPPSPCSAEIVPPADLELGDLVNLEPKLSAPLVREPIHHATFIDYATSGGLDRDALIIVDAAGERVEVLEREYSTHRIR